HWSHTSSTHERPYSPTAPLQPLPFVFTDPVHTETHTLSLHDALPICCGFYPSRHETQPPPGHRCGCGRPTLQPMERDSRRGVRDPSAAHPGQVPPNQTCRSGGVLRHQCCITSAR